MCKWECTSGQLVNMNCESNWKRVHYFKDICLKNTLKSYTVTILSLSSKSCQNHIINIGVYVKYLACMWVQMCCRTEFSVSFCESVVIEQTRGEKLFDL